MTNEKYKIKFIKELKTFATTLTNHVSTDDGQWSIKGFIDAYKNVYTISSDTKIVSKIFEIHLFPKLLEFAEKVGYRIVLADHQNYYPDLTFVNSKLDKIKFAVDLKTTFFNPKNVEKCNGFTLGSHGTYFKDRKSTKNIQFPYDEYSGHICLGIIYSRTDEEKIDETKMHPLKELSSITSVVNGINFFIAEKWKIASDKRGSGNTANIGSITKVSDIYSGNGMFSKLGEDWFDDYWMNYDLITVKDKDGKTSTIKNLLDFVKYRKGEANLIVKKS